MDIYYTIGPRLCGNLLCIFKTKKSVQVSGGDLVMPTTEGFGAHGGLTGL